jgi:hypothetical protein
MKKYFKITGLTFGTLVIIYLTLCVFSPRSFMAEKSITINKSPESIFETVSDFSTWTRWSPWQKSDSLMVSQYQGTPGTVGHKTSWKSKKEGNGAQEIVELSKNEYIKTAIHVSPDPNTVFFSEWYFSGDSLQTNVTWTMNSGTMPFLQRGAAFIFDMKSTMEDYYDRGLNDLKKVVEENE